ncbi:MAG: Tad domain-containing protein [Deltaproteobacteria bacterium]|nr:Tad domain-containing protein [Deltaproteobacteria bacterium]
MSLGERGQVLVIGLVSALGLAIISLSVANVGIMISEKMHVQDTVDAAAYSAAVTEARYMNLTAYINRAMIANYDLMAFNTAMWATMNGYDHGIAPVLTLGYLLGFVVEKIPIINALGPIIDVAVNILDRTFHFAVHEAARGLGAVFGQDEDHFDQMDFNNIIEIYITDVLSTYQGLLHVATQAARYRVIEEVAQKMDPEVSTTTLLGLAAETLSADELKRSVDWVIDAPDKRISGMSMPNEAFNRVMLEDEEIRSAPSGGEYDREPSLDSDDKLVMLGAMTEASLDKFAAGRDREGEPNMIRAFNFGDLIPEAFKIAFVPIMVADCLADCITFWDGCDCDFDTHMVIGAAVDDDSEDCFEQSHVPVIARQRFREVNFFGVDMNLSIMMTFINAIVSAATGQEIKQSMGYTSGQSKADIENIDNMIEPNDFDTDRLLECVLGFGGCQNNMLNIIMSGVTLTAVAAVATEDKIDDHWDGSFEAKPTCAVLRASSGTPCYDETADYVSDATSAGQYSDGTPKYDLRTDMNLVGWTHYHYDETDAPTRPEGTSGGDSNNLLAGPSIGVVGFKPADKINGLRGLGLDPTYPISAISRAQVYYVRNPNRPEERPNMLNPHWVARLAPLDSPETPKTLSEGLPFVASMGAPFKPTH